MRRKLHPRASAASARDLSEALAWHLQSGRKARQLTQLAIAMTGSRFLEHPESQLYVDVSQRKYTCKPSGKFSEFDPDFIHFEWFQKRLPSLGIARVFQGIHWLIGSGGSGDLKIPSGCGRAALADEVLGLVCSFYRQPTTADAHQPADAICSQSSGCSE